MLGAGIDRLRLDKYMSLVRKLVNHVFQYLHTHNWDHALIDSVAALFSGQPPPATSLLPF